MISYEIAYDCENAEKAIYMFEREQFLYKEGYLYISLKVDDWNSELSPWPFSTGKMNFAGKGAETLAELLKIIPEAEKGKNIRERYIAGYSLGALFALYAVAETDMFAGAVSCSASLWFEGFSDYFCRKVKPQRKTFYISLGAKEEKTRNQVMATVGDNTRRIYSFLKENGAAVVLVYNEGGHFNEPEVRFQRGLHWLTEYGKA